MGLFAKFKEAWLKPMSFDSLNEGFYDDLEEALILADSIAVVSSVVKSSLRPSSSIVAWRTASA